MIKNKGKKVPLKNITSKTNNKFIRVGPKIWPTKMNVSLDEELYENIKLLAEKEGRSMTKQLQYLIKQSLRYCIK